MSFHLASPPRQREESPRGSKLPTDRIYPGHTLPTEHATVPDIREPDKPKLASRLPELLVPGRCVILETPADSHKMLAVAQIQVGLFLLL